jgi:hypothetical protein
MLNPQRKWEDTHIATKRLSYVKKIMGSWMSSMIYVLVLMNFRSRLKYTEDQLAKCQERINKLTIESGGSGQSANQMKAPWGIFGSVKNSFDLRVRIITFQPLLLSLTEDTITIINDRPLNKYFSIIHEIS